MIVKVVRLIESNQYIYENKPYGSVDLRTSESETEEEKRAANESLKSFNYLTDDKNVLRLVAIFENDTLKKVINDAELLFEETIDLLKMQFITKIRNYEGAGYWVNMETGETNPFLKEKENEDILGRIYQISLGPYSPMLGEQIMASCKNEAIEAFKRSIHWYNESKSQNKSYLQFLYKWIAIETLTKISEEDDIIPKLCLVIAFPLSKKYKTIPKNETDRLENIIEKNRFKKYKELIREELYNCRKIRNSIVHSGFKEINLVNQNMDLKLCIINAVFRCLYNTIEKIIFSGKNSIIEIWDVMSEYIMKDENLIKWVSETFIYEIERIRTESGKLPVSNPIF